MEDDTFRARVQKVFGSLSSSLSPSLRPPWSLTDDEVEKREWRQGTSGSGRDDDQIPCSASFDGLFVEGRRRSRNTRRERRAHDLEDHSDDDEDEQFVGGSSRRKHSSERADDDDDGDRDDWEIRSSIGLDCTLDDEEEEDEYDKVAEGTENVGDFLYMSDVNNHGPYLNSQNVLPSSVYHASRDLRANRIAARTRLKEDELEAQEFGSKPYWDKSLSNLEGGCIKRSKGGGGGELKSILKRKINAADSKVVKRVRFDPDCKDNCEEASEKLKDFITGTPSLETSISDDNSSLGRRVPDYVLNPSKYKRYSFDSPIEVNAECKSEVCMVLEESKPPGSESQSSSASSSDLPKSVTFIPRKKGSGTRPVKDNRNELKENQDDGCKQSTSIQTGLPLGIAAGETQRSEASVIEEELETSTTRTGFQKPGRHYRAKSKLDDPVY